MEVGDVLKPGCVYAGLIVVLEESSSLPPCWACMFSLCEKCSFFSWTPCSFLPTASSLPSMQSEDPVLPAAHPALSTWWWSTTCASSQWCDWCPSSWASRLLRHTQNWLNRSHMCVGLLLPGFHLRRSQRGHLHGHAVSLTTLLWLTPPSFYHPPWTLWNAWWRKANKGRKLTPSTLHSVSIPPHRVFIGEDLESLQRLHFWCHLSVKSRPCVYAVVLFLNADGVNDGVYQLSSLIQQ